VEPWYADWDIMAADGSEAVELPMAIEGSSWRAVFIHQTPEGTPAGEAGTCWLDTTVGVFSATVVVH